MWLENLSRFIDGKPKKDQTYQVTFTSWHKIPCPAFWRHPMRWLRWNPLMMTRLSYTMNGVTMERDRSERPSFIFCPPLQISEPH